MRPELKDFYRACQNVIDNMDQRSVNWAVNYAQNGLKINDIHEAQMQAMYILGNITRWKGKVAQETRIILKSMC